MYAENVAKGGCPVVHIVVFNRRALQDLDRILSDIVAWGFRTFNFSAISAWVPEHNRLALALVARLGWDYDGRLRSYALFGGKYEDVFVYSVTKEWAPPSRSSQDF